MTHADDILALLPLPPAVFHILIALAHDELHGYAIMQEVATLSGDTIRLGPGTLYRSVQRMLEQGLIVEAKRRPAAAIDDERRRYYRITPLGTRAARGEAQRLSDLLHLARAQGLTPERA